MINFAPKLYAMVTRETIREIIIDNRQQVAKREIISRNFNFMDNACYVLIGVRRAGKSYLLYQRILQLIRDGHTWEEIVYINFEDERLLEMQAADLNKILEVHQMMTDKMPLLFLDEIQNIAGWDKFARRLAENKYTVIVTGSNAKMLSQDVATTLGGKFIIKEVFPYSFQEFLGAKEVVLDGNSFYSTSQRSEIQKYMLDKEREYKKLSTPVERKNFEETTAKELARRQEAFLRVKERKEAEIDTAIKNAIKSTAIANKIDTVVDSSVVFFGGIDITDKVVKALNSPGVAK